MHAYSRGFIALAAASTLVLAACGGGSDSASEGTASGSEMSGMEAEEGAFVFGEAADVADADRTVKIEALDALAWDPAEIEVKAGEVVTFEITNGGAIRHEFTIGDQAEQEAHEEEMRELGGEMEMDADPNAVVIEAGESATITWKFAEAGDVQFACHEPGHFAGGMVGDFKVS